MNILDLHHKVIQNFNLYSVEVALLSFSLYLANHVFNHRSELRLESLLTENVVGLPLAAVLGRHEQVEPLQCDLHR